MRIRIINTITEPNLNGTVNINDTKAEQILDLFLLNNGIEEELSNEAKLETVARLLKEYIISSAKDMLRRTRDAAERKKFLEDTVDFD